MTARRWVPEFLPAILACALVLVAPCRAAWVEYQWARAVTDDFDHIHHTRMFSETDGILVRSRHIHRTRDGGLTWERTGSFPADVSSVDSAAFCDPDTGWAQVRDSAGVYDYRRTRDGGATWEPYAANLDGSVYGLLPLSYDRCLVRQSGGLYLTHAGSPTWTEVLGSGVTEDSGGYMICELRRLGTQTILAGTDGGYVAVSTDSGSTWALSQRIGDFGEECMAVCFTDPQTGYAALDEGAETPGSGLYRTLDGGQTWSALDPSATGIGDENVGSIDATSSGSLYVTTHVGRVIRSTNQGDSWALISPAGAADLPLSDGVRIYTDDFGLGRYGYRLYAFGANVQVTAKRTDEADIRFPYLLAINGTEVSLEGTAQGKLTIPILDPGTSTLTFGGHGFKTLDRQVTLAPYETLELPVTLESSAVDFGELALTGDPDHSHRCRAWAPSQRGILFTRNDELLLRDPNHDEPELLAAAQGLAQVFGTSVWSPDQSGIASLQRFATGSYGDLYLIDPDGTEPSVQLNDGDDTRDTDFSWSPDGRYLVYGRSKPEYGVYRVDVTDGTEVLLFGTENQNVDEVLWAADQRVFCRTSSGDCWVVPAFGGTAEKVVVDWGENLGFESLALDPTRRRLAAVVRDPSTARYFLVTFGHDLGDVTEVLDLYTVVAAGGDVRDPVWSPTGRYLALLIDDYTGYHQVYTIPVEGGLATAVTDSRYHHSFLHWSPDESQLAFSVTDATERPQLYVSTVGQPVNTNLQITDLRLQPASGFVAGDTVDLVATVHNAGTGAVQTGFSVEFGLDNGRKQTEPVGGGLAAGASVDVTTEWIVVAGTHTLSAFADSHEDIPELNEGDNLAQTEASVPYPDLTLENPAFSPTTGIVAGSQVELTADLRNLGAGFNTPVKVRFLVDDDPVGARTVYRMEPGAVEPLTVTWTVPPTDQPVLTVVADPDQIFPESDETNNQVTLALPITVEAPDFTITALDMVPDLPAAGDPVQFVAKVRNTGAGDWAHAVHTSLLIDGVMQRSRQVEGLASQDERELVFEWIFQAGSETAVVVADPDDLVVETREDNNTLALDLPYVAAPDLVVQDLSLTPVDGVVDGTPVRVEARVANVGEGDTTALFPVVFGTEAANIGWVNLANGLAAGASTTVAVDWDMLAGTQELTARIDPNNDVVESDETNNTRSHELSPVPRADLTVTDLRWAPEVFADGDTVTFSATVANLGGSTVRRIPVEFLADGAAIERTHIAEGLATGAEAEVVANWTCRAGTEAVQVRANPGWSVPEDNKDNNTAESPLPDVPLPDLVVAQAWWSPENYRIGDRVVLSARIENRGEGATSRDFVIDFRVDDRRAGIVEAFPDLGPGESVTVAVEWETDFARILEIHADAGDRVGEGQEGELNNTFQLDLPDIPFPDLSVTGLDWTPDTGLSAGTPVTFVVTVENLGSNFSDEFAVRLFLDGNEYETRGIQGGLWTGQPVDVPFLWDAVPGDSHTVRAVADPSGDIPEEVLDNNETTREFTVAIVAPDLRITGPAVSPIDGLTVGSDVTFSATLENTGAGAYEGVVPVGFLVDGRLVGEATVTGGLAAAGGNRDVSVPWTVDDRTTGQLEVRADLHGQVDESDETNNSAVLDLPAVARPDLTVTAVAIEPVDGGAGTVRDGDPVLITATIRNTRAVAARGDFSVDAGIGLWDDRLTVRNGLAAGAEVTLEFPWTAAPGTDGPLVVTVDPEARVAETDETNNRAEIEIPFQVERVDDFFVSLDPASATAVLGQSAAFSVELRNRLLSSSYFDLVVQGLEGLDHRLEAQRVFLLAGESRELDLIVDLGVEGGRSGTEHAFTVSATSSAAFATKTAAGTLTILDAPVPERLLPADAAVLGTRNVHVTWTTSVPSSSEVRLRAEGESQDSLHTGLPGTRHDVLLPDLVRGLTYTYSVSGTTDAGTTYTSDARTFSVDRGIDFTEPSFEFEVERDYNQRLELGVSNLDSVPHVLEMVIDNPYPDLVLDFIGPGSRDNPIPLNPGEKQTVVLGTHLQDAEREVYDLTATITSRREQKTLTATVPVRIQVHVPVFDYSITELSTDPVTLTKRFRVVNNGDTITDFSVDVDRDIQLDYGTPIAGNLREAVVLHPAIRHYRLEAGASLEFEVVPMLGHPLFQAVFGPETLNTGRAGERCLDLSVAATAAGLGDPPVTEPGPTRGDSDAPLLAAAGAVRAVVDTSFRARDGQAAYPGQVENPTHESSTESWHCTNRPDIEEQADGPPVDGEDDVDSDPLYITFSPRSDARPHDTYLYLNDHLIASFRSQIPSGTHKIEFDPAILNYAAIGPARNKVQIHTVHMNGGHYVVASRIRLRSYLRSYTHYVMADSPEQALDLVAGNLPSTMAPSPGDVTFGDLETDGPVIEGRAVHLRQPITAADGSPALGLTVTLELSGDEILLLDDDRDGVYEGEWLARTTPEQRAETGRGPVRAGGSVQAKWSGGGGGGGVTVDVSPPEEGQTNLNLAITAPVSDFEVISGYNLRIEMRVTDGEGNPVSPDTLGAEVAVWREDTGRVRGDLSMEETSPGVFVCDWRATPDPGSREADAPLAYDVRIVGRATRDESRAVASVSGTMLLSRKVEIRYNYPGYDSHREVVRFAPGTSVLEVSGLVTDRAGGEPMGNVQVYVSYGAGQSMTLLTEDQGDLRGKYAFEIRVRDDDSAAGLEQQTVDVGLVRTENTIVVQGAKAGYQTSYLPVGYTAALQATPPCRYLKVVGVVKDENDQPLDGALVDVRDIPLDQPVTTANGGAFEFVVDIGGEQGTHTENVVLHLQKRHDVTVTVSKPGYVTQTAVFPMPDPIPAHVKVSGTVRHEVWDAQAGQTLEQGLRDAEVTVAWGSVQRQLVTPANGAYSLSLALPPGLGADRDEAWDVLLEPALGGFRFAPVAEQVAGRPFVLEITALDLQGNPLNAWNGAVGLTDTTTTLTPGQLVFQNGIGRTDQAQVMQASDSVVITLEHGGQTWDSSAFKVVDFGVLETDPAKDGTLRAPDPAGPLVLTATFNDDVDMTSFSSGQVTVSYKDGTSTVEISGTTVSEGATGIRWFSDSALQDLGVAVGKTVTAEIAAGVQSVNGASMPDAYTWNFSVPPLNLTLDVIPVQTMRDPTDLTGPVEFFWGRQAVVLVKVGWDEEKSDVRSFPVTVTLTYDGTQQQVYNRTVYNGRMLDSQRWRNLSTAERQFRWDGYYLVMQAATLYSGTYGQHTVTASVTHAGQQAPVFQGPTRTVNVVRLRQAHEYYNGLYFVPLALGAWQQQAQGAQTNVGRTYRAASDACARKLLPVPPGEYNSPPAFGGYHPIQNGTIAELLAQLEVLRVNVRSPNGGVPFATMGIVEKDYNLDDAEGITIGNSYRAGLIHEFNTGTNTVEGNVPLHESGHVLEFYGRFSRVHTPWEYSLFGYDHEQKRLVSVTDVVKSGSGASEGSGPTSRLHGLLGHNKGLMDKWLTDTRDDKTWISAYAYERFAGHFRVTREDGRTDEAQSLVVWGRMKRVDGLDFVLFQDPVFVDAPPAFQDIPPGDYVFAWYDAGGAELGSVSFDPGFGDETAPDSRTPVQDMSPGVFLFHIPYSEAIHEFRVLRHDTRETLQSVNASPSAPLLDLVAPDGSDVTGPLDIRWHGLDPDGDELRYTVLFSPDDGVSWVPLRIEFSGESLQVDANTLANGAACRVKVKACDGFHTTEALSPAFRVRTAPAVVLTTPRDGDSRAVVTTPVSAQFRDAMDPGTVTQATVTVESAGAPVPGTVTYDGSVHTAVFTPDEPLGHGQSYSVSLSTGIRDLQGQPLPQAYDWQFTVEPDPVVNLAPTVRLSASVLTGETPLNVTFTAEGQDEDGSVALYRWDFEGDGSDDLETETGDVAHEYTDEGVYFPRVTAVDNDGLEARAALRVAVTAPNQAPSIAVTAEPASGDAPLTTVLTASGTDPDGTIVEYGWDVDGDHFVDARTTTATLEYEFAFPGTHAVRVTAMDDRGAASTAETEVTVTGSAPLAPVAEFTAEPRIATTRTAVQFQDLSAGTVKKRLWLFGDGNSSTDTNPVHTYTQSGLYTVSLTVNGHGNGDTETKFDYIEVIPNQTLTVRVTGNGTVRSEPVGIDCRDECSAEFPRGTAVTLSAQADEGWAFSGWAGDADGADPGAQVTMAGDRLVEAVFVKLEPDALVAPSWLHFGNVAVGAASVAEAVTVSNGGNGILTIESVNVSGTNASEFELESTGRAWQTVAPGGAVQVEVVFSPSASGAREAELVVVTDDPDTPAMTVTLAGAGTDGSAAAYTEMPQTTFTEDTELGPGTYLVTGHVYLAKGVTVTLKPGTVLKFSGASLVFHVGGATLEAHGTMAAPVVFTSAADPDHGAPIPDSGTVAAGDWGGLWTGWSDDQTVGAQVTLEHCILRYAGGNSYLPGAISAYGVSPSLTSCTIEQSDRNGVYAVAQVVDGAMRPVSLTLRQCRLAGNAWDGAFLDHDVVTGTPSSSVPVIESCQFVANHGFAMRLEDNVFPTMDGRNQVVFTAGVTNAVARYGTVHHSGTVHNPGPGLAYWLESDLVITGGAVVGVDPGVVFKGNGSGRVIAVYGSTLNALGTRQNPVVFTSSQDDTAAGDSNGDGTETAPAAGQWGCVLLDRSADGSVAATARFTHCHFRYGGGNSYNPALVTVIGSAPSITDSVFEHSSRNGLGLYPRAAGEAVHSADPVITTCRFSFNAWDGIFADHNPTTPPTAARPSILSCVFQGNAESAVELQDNVYPVFDARNRVVFCSDCRNGIERHGDLTASGTIADPGSDMAYVLTGNLTVAQGAVVEVAAGVIFKGDYGGRAVDVFGGTFDVAGTEARPVVFTSDADDTVGGDSNGDGTETRPSPGDWGSLIFRRGADGTVAGTGTLSHCRFRYGGGDGYNPGLVTVSGTAPTLTACRFEYSARNGLGLFPIRYGEVVYPAEPVVVEGSFAANAWDGIFADHDPTEPPTSARPAISSCTFEGNRESAIELQDNVFPVFDGQNTIVPAEGCMNAVARHGYLNASGALEYPGPGFAYVLVGNLTVPSGAVLEIEPGVVLKGDYSGRTVDVVGGTLRALGTAETPVVVTSAADDTVAGDSNGDGNDTRPEPGDWGSILFRRSDDGSVAGSGSLTHCRLSYGGGDGYNPGLVVVVGTAPTLSQCTLEHSGRNGMCLYPAVIGADVYPAEPVIGQSRFSDNAWDGLYGYHSCTEPATRSAPAVSGCVFEGNRESAMDFDGNVFAVFDAQNVVVVRTGCESGIALRGTVNAPGTLTVAGPAFPYVLAGDLNLIPGGNLSIGPGVVIKGGGYYETLDVQGGSLSALGTADQPILFTSVADDTAGGDTNGDGGDTLPAEVPWGGVVVRWATNASTQGTGTFEHCVFRHGAGEQRGMLEGSGGAVTLDDCRFEASDEDGLWLEPAVVDGVHRPPEFLVRNCVITGAADDGIQIQGNDTGLTGSIDGVIDRCTIAANGDNGITAGNGFNGTIQGCRIQANGTDGIRLRQAAPTVMNNLISDHSGNNGDGVEMSDGSNPVLTGNRIRGNVTGVWASSGSQPQLSGNSISHNLEEGLHNADSSVCLEARDNWWGHDSGPRDSSDDTASACGDYNPEGRGDRVSDQVRYRPWLGQNPHADGVVGTWTLDEGQGAVAADGAGQVGDLTVYGAEWVAVGDGGTALALDGLDDFAAATASTEIAGGEGLTVCCWFKFDEPSEGGLVSTFTGSAGYELGVDQDTLAWTAVVDGAVVRVAVPRRDVTRHKWHYATGVFDGAALRVFLDGVVKGSIDCTGSLTVAGEAPLTVGASAAAVQGRGQDTGFFRGYVDDVCVVRGVLSSDEVRARMRAAPPRGAGLPGTAVSGDLEETTVWRAALSPYIMTDDVNVSPGVTLYVEPGVTVLVESGGHRLEVDGTLFAREAVFTARAAGAERGEWDGVGFYEQSRDSRLEACVVKYGGRGDGAIEVEGCDPVLVDCLVAESGSNGISLRDSMAVIDRCEIRDNHDSGIDTRASAPSVPTVRDCVFVDNAYPVWQALDCYPVYEGRNRSRVTTAGADASRRNGIRIGGGHVTLSGTWDRGFVPYIVEDDVEVDTGVGLVVVEGSVVKFEPGNVGIEVSGTLVAAGVRFTSLADDTVQGDTGGDGPGWGRPGDWDAIEFYDGSSGSSLIDCAVLYAGRSGDDAGIEIHESSPTLTRCLIAEANGRGIGLWNSAAVLDRCVIRDNRGPGIDTWDSAPSGPVVRDCLFVDNDVALWQARDTYPVFEGCNASRVTPNTGRWNGIRVSGGDWTLSGAWSATFVPYIVTSDVHVSAGTTLELDPGVTVKFEPGNVGLSVNGTLLARHATLTSLRDDSAGGDTNGDGAGFGSRGDWDALELYEGSDASEVRDCVIRYAGLGSNDAGIEVHDVSPVLSGCRITDSGRHGVVLWNAAPTVDDCLIHRNRGSGVDCNDGSDPLLTGNEITANGTGVWSGSGSSPSVREGVVAGNREYGVENEDESVCVDARDNWWGDSSGPLDESDDSEQACGNCNPDGGGDRVSDHVRYEPWLGAGPHRTVKLTLTLVGNGTVELAPPGMRVRESAVFAFRYGARVCLTGRPDPGGQSVVWEPGALEGRQRVLTLERDTEITVVFGAGSPAIVCDVVEHDFGGVVAGRCADQLLVTVLNNGAVDLVLGELALQGDAAAVFSLDQDLISGRTLQGGQAGSVVVTFSPATLGDVRADLAIPSNDPDTPVLVVPLTGTGVTDPRVRQDLVLDPGWNLVSFRMDLEDVRSRTAFDAVSVGGVWYWDADEQAYALTREFASTKGYWVYVPELTVVPGLTGLRPEQQTLNGRPGWNLFGPVGEGDEAELPQEPERALYRVWEWQTVPGLYRSAPSLRSGRGYWIHLRGQAVLEIGLD